MPSPIGLPPAQLRASAPRKERAELPFGPAAKLTQVLPADSKVVKEPSGIVLHPGRGTGRRLHLGAEGIWLHSEAQFQLHSFLFPSRRGTKNARRMGLHPDAGVGRIR